jgi:ribonuclease BN (tRNA processing enzyme)
MKLTFLGTRGNIEVRNRLHRIHTSMMVSYYQKRIMVDCGEDWLGNLDLINPHAIVITHGHPDHAFGLKEGAPHKADSGDERIKGRIAWRCLKIEKMPVGSWPKN